MNDVKTQKTVDKEAIYRLTSQHILIITILTISSLFLGFMMNFSITDKVSSIIEANITKNRACPMRTERIDLALFFPKIQITDLEISSTCLKSPNPLMLSSVISQLSLPSFSPFGASVSTQISDKFSKFNILSVHNISANYFKIESKTLNASSLQALIPNFKLAGVFELNSNIEVAKNSLNDLTIHLKSTNFQIPSQNIEGFEIPNLKIGPMSLKAKLKTKNKLDLLELIIGNELSPIRANLSGVINLNQFNIAQSVVDLSLTVKFSQSFIDSFSILNLFLDTSKQDAQGFYKMKLSGPISKLNKPEYLK